MKFKEFAIISAVATMFDSNEEFDSKSQKKLVQFLLKKGIDGFYIGGSTGEGFMIGTEDRKRVISEVYKSLGTRFKKLLMLAA